MADNIKTMKDHLQAWNHTINLSLADAPFYGSAYSGVPGSEIMKTLNEEQKDMISYYIMGVSTISICCAGAVVNMLSLVVLTRRSVGTPTTSAYLISLAAADLLVLFATILTAIKDARRPVRDQLLMLLWQDVQFIPGAYPYFHATAILFQVNVINDRYRNHDFVAKVLI
ncbi:unnamed protein product [Calicophoron daubneyi]|uniref:G-protein coupled receptors family 1 profile domain-containing protein n=1 Tax=Calicophoron daubneyi TaxID=300641 RepID=A0AAV2TU79_CALDB